MLLGGPAGHVGADLRDQFQRRVGPDAINLCEIDPAGELMQRRADFEDGVVVDGPTSDAWRGQRCGRDVARGGQVLDLAFNGAITKPSPSLAVSAPAIPANIFRASSSCVLVC